MNAPLVLKPTSTPTVERPEFKQVLAASKSMRGKAPRRAVRAWAELMKRALRASDGR